MPMWREWDEATVKWWAELWSSPQAVMWDQSGQSLHQLALLQDDLIVIAAKKPGSIQLTQLIGQMRQVQARHGLDPRSMADMKWRVGEPGQQTGATVLSIVRDTDEAHPPAGDMPGKRDAKAAWVEWSVRCGMERGVAKRLTKAVLIQQYSSRGKPAPAERPVSKAAERLREHAAKKPTGRKR